MTVMRASAVGAVALAAAQAVDMAITGRPASGVPVRVVERLTGRTLKSAVVRTAAGYAAQSSIALSAALSARLAGGSATRQAGTAFASAVGGGAIVDGALGAVEAPWHWTPAGWAREAALKGALAIAVVAALRLPSASTG